MKRRSFFQILTAFTAALFLPPIRVARALGKRLPPAPRWLTGRKKWEHLAVPVPEPAFRRYAVEGENDARVVCRVLGPRHFNTRLDEGAFEAALEEAGWSEEEIQLRLNPGLLVQCAGCSRTWTGHRYYRYRDMNTPGWQVECNHGIWSARCPDHREPLVA